MVDALSPLPLHPLVDVDHLLGIHTVLGELPRSPKCQEFEKLLNDSYPEWRKARDSQREGGRTRGAGTRVATLTAT